MIPITVLIERGANGILRAWIEPRQSSSKQWLAGRQITAVGSAKKIVGRELESVLRGQELKITWRVVE